METGRRYRQIRLKSGIRQKVQEGSDERRKWAVGRGRLGWRAMPEASRKEGPDLVGAGVKKLTSAGG
jgi:hypothetical protein